MKQPFEPMKTDISEHFWEEGWAHITTFVDVVREPVLILDKDLRVITANESFYQMFQVEKKDTEGKIVYELGNGQWNIPSLRKLLEDILPQNTFFKGFEVTNNFPLIGRKVMLLNARRIYKDNAASDTFPPIILLAMEDVTEMMTIAEKLVDHTNQLESGVMERTRQMEVHIAALDKEINELKNK